MAEFGKGPLTRHSGDLSPEGRGEKEHDACRPLTSPLGERSGFAKQGPGEGAFPATRHP